MNVLAISSLDFSRGGAAQARQRHLLSGLQSAGINVTLLNLQHSYGTQPPFNIVTLPSISRHAPWRIVLSLLYLPKLILLLMKNRASILCFDRDLQVLLTALGISKLFGRDIYHEITEFPSEIIPRGLYGWLSLIIFERFIIKRLTGVIVISRTLAAYVKNYNPFANILLIPATATPPQIGPSAPHRDNSFRFVYTGSFSERKDGVISLLAAFHYVLSAHKEARLTLYGDGTRAQREALLRRSLDSGIGNAVNIERPVPQSEVPQVLAGADALVLCRPYSKQARGGFPTKLAEYLASSRPVITTITGDISRYLENGVSAYLAPANDEHAFAQCMIAAIRNRSTNEDMGARGRADFDRYFDAGPAAYRVARWLSDKSTRGAK